MPKWQPSEELTPGQTENSMRRGEGNASAGTKLKKATEDNHWRSAHVPKLSSWKYNSTLDKWLQSSTGYNT